MENEKTSKQTVAEVSNNLKKQNTSKAFFLKSHQELIEDCIKKSFSYSKISQYIQKNYYKKISTETIRKFVISTRGNQTWKNKKPNKISISEKILKNNSSSFLEVYDLLTQKEKSFLVQDTLDENKNKILSILKYANDNLTWEEGQDIEKFLSWIEAKQREEDGEIIDVVIKIEKYFLSEDNYQFSPNDIQFFGDEKTFLNITKLLEKRNLYTGKDLRFFAIKIRDDYEDYLSVIYD